MTSEPNTPEDVPHYPRPNPNDTTPRSEDGYPLNPDGIKSTPEAAEKWKRAWPRTHGTEYRGTDFVGEACGATPTPEATELLAQQTNVVEYRFQNVPCWVVATRPRGTKQEAMVDAWSFALAIDQHTERLRETNARLNRRCQQAEAGIKDAKRSFEHLKTNPWCGGSLGRAFLSVLYGQAKEEIATLRAQVEALKAARKAWEQVARRAGVVMAPEQDAADARCRALGIELE